jgi:hypothetical protein
MGYREPDVLVKFYGRHVAQAHRKTLRTVTRWFRRRGHYNDYIHIDILMTVSKFDCETTLKKKLLCLQFVRAAVACVGYEKGVG